MKKLTEGRKMYVSVMVIFVIYALFFIAFEDYDRNFLQPFQENSDWHLLIFSLVVMAGLSILLHRYSHRMDERISREQAEKENQMRRELTQNIAHELKTPVASILGYTDTIIDNPDLDSKTREQFIIRARVQALRLTALLQDISTLNRMDYAADMLTIEEVNVTQIVDEIIQETAIAADEKQMTTQKDLPDEILIEGNHSLLYSIFRNLMDNAINYAGTGSHVEVLATEDNDRWRFVFQDNGQGIDTSHLTRIFERFYRIDKGRSRSLGGTGLGLAIVKNAVQIHGGSIKAINVDTGGLRFEFDLKKKMSSAHINTRVQPKQQGI